MAYIFYFKYFSLTKIGEIGDEIDPVLENREVCSILRYFFNLLLSQLDTGNTELRSAFELLLLEKLASHNFLVWVLSQKRVLTSLGEILLNVFV